MKCRNEKAKRRPLTAIMPTINSHRTNIEIYEAIKCYVKTNASVTFQFKGKQIDIIKLG